MTIIEVTDATFQAEVLNSPKPVLVEFLAQWCGPCRQIAPLLELTAEEYKEKLAVAKIDIDNNPETPNKYGVRGIPTLMIFRDGKIVGAKIGALTRARLFNWINETLGC